MELLQTELLSWLVNAVLVLNIIVSFCIIDMWKSYKQKLREEKKQ